MLNLDDTRSWTWAVGALLGLVAGCGDDAAVEDDPDVAPCTAPRATRLLPLAVGATWTYDVTDLTEPGAPTVAKTTTVLALEDTGDRKQGTQAFRMRTEKVRGTTVSWQEDRCTAVVRHREQSFDAAGVLESDQFYTPSKLRVDETPPHLVLGASWTVAYQETEVDPVLGGTTGSKGENRNGRDLRQRRAAQAHLGRRRQAVLVRPRGRQGQGDRRTARGAARVHAVTAGTRPYRGRRACAAAPACAGARPRDRVPRSSRPPRMA